MEILTHNINADISSCAMSSSIPYVLSVDGVFEITWYPD